MAVATQMYLEEIADDGQVTEQTLAQADSDDEIEEIPRDDDKTVSTENTPTPQNSAGSSQDSTPKAKKRLTPKEKRLITKDRYKTFTLDYEEFSSSNEQSPLHRERKSEASRGQKTNSLNLENQTIDSHSYSFEEHINANGSLPKRSNATAIKQRRAEAKERFKTRTICEGDLVGSRRENPSQDRHSFGGIENKHKYPIQPNMCDIDMSHFPGSNEGLGVDFELPSDEMLKKEANLVIRTLNHKKRRSIDENIEYIIDIENISIVSNESESENGKVESCVFEDDAQNNNVIHTGEDSSSDSNQECKTKGPRIVKPGGRRVVEEQETKSIRGRRKPLYSSNKSSSSNSSTPTKYQQPRGNSSPSVARKGHSSPSLKTSPLAVRPTRASSLRQTNTHTQKTVTPQSTPSSSPRHPRKPPQPPPKPPSLVRQNTFNKDEPTQKENTPVADGQSKTCQSGAKNKVPPKIPPKPKLRKDSVQPFFAEPVRKSVSNTMKQSPSSHSLQGTPCTTPLAEKPKRSGASALCGGRRTGSSTSLSSSSSASTGRSVVPGAPPPSKEVTSKIAFLWRKVEESRSKAMKGKTKDNRVWITNQSELDQNSNAKPAVVKSRSRLSLRLSRFTDKSKPKETKSKGVSTPTTDLPNPSKRQQDCENEDSVAFKRVSRLGSFMRFEGDKEGKRKEDSPPVRSPQSAIVPPFNYIPSGRRSADVSPSQAISTGRTFAPKVIPAQGGVRRSNSYLSSVEGGQGRGRGRGGSVMITTV